MQYRLILNEREFEMVLSALGLIAETDAENGHPIEAKEARELLVRLDMEGDEQFIEQRERFK